jgi:hypothetical protein
MAIKKKETPKKSMAKTPNLPVSSKMKTLPTVKPYREAPREGGELKEAWVGAKRPAKKPMAMPKAPVSSSISTLPTLKAPAPKPGKKMGRLATAASDATSSLRGAANLAFGKNKSQTTGGKILERVARVGAVATGMGAAGIPGSVANYGTKIASATNKATGYIRKGAVAASKKALKESLGMGGLAGVAIPVIKGQMNFKNRTEESKKRGIFNPGKGKANLGNINFDKPFQKKKKK